MGCLFCELIKGQRKAAIVYEDETVLAFEDINPQSPVHVLVVPRKHISTCLEIADEDRETIGKMFQAANHIARERKIADRGFRLVMNCNADAGQSVFHIHLHVLGGRLMHWPPG